MKRSYTAFFLSIIMLLSLCGCSFDSESSKSQNYIRRLNEELALFTECADEFSASLKKIDDTTTVPSEAELDKIAANISDLSDICTRIQSMEAPAEYADAASLLADSMQKYTSAFQKCSELLNFYKEFDSKIREYKDPTAGSEELQQKAKEIYREFASLMQQATVSLHEAQDAFDEDKS